MNEKHTRNRQFRETIKKALNDGSIFSWARAGATDKQIADFLGIAESSFYKVKNEITELTEVIKEARKPIIPKMYDNLIKVANGYHYEESEDEYKEVLDAKGEITQLHNRKIKRLYAKPDSTAIARVLINYQKQYREGKEGYPMHFVSEPLTAQDETKKGKLPEMEEAMNELFKVRHEVEE